MQSIIKKIKKMDKKIVKMINIGQWIFFLISLMGVAILLIHYKLYISAELYYVGIEVFKLGIIGVAPNFPLRLMMTFMPSKAVS